MSTRKFFTVMNLLMPLLAAILLVGGAVLAVRLAAKDSMTTLPTAELQAVHELMTEQAKESKSDLNQMYAQFPEGYGLLWVDTKNTLLEHQNVDEITIKLFLSRFVREQAGGTYTYYGITFVTVRLAHTTVVAVNTSQSYVHRLQISLLIYGIATTALLFICFIICAVVESAAIYPGLADLRRAMTEVYNGNYAQVVRLRHDKRPNDIGQLLVEFDRLRRRIADAIKAKEDADRERGVMISGISHDLRTPLTVIQVHAKGLVDGVAQRMGKTEQYYDNIYSTACSMLSLVDKLAEFSKVETHTVTYSFIERDLGAVLQEYVNNHYIPYAARGLKFKLRLPKGHPLTVNLDKEQFLRVLQNICDNSLKYKDKETCIMTISAEIRNEEVVLRLADDGPGIGDFEAEYIFESYYRGDPSRTNPISGSGLGLSIVKNIILAHKGQIQAYNNNGLTIEITLPYRRKK